MYIHIYIYIDVECRIPTHFDNRYPKIHKKANKIKMEYNLRNPCGLNNKLSSRIFIRFNIIKYLTIDDMPNGMMRRDLETRRQFN